MADCLLLVVAAASFDGFGSMVTLLDATSRTTTTDVRCLSLV